MLLLVFKNTGNKKFASGKDVAIFHETDTYTREIKTYIQRLVQEWSSQPIHNS